jgi:MFS family permease
MEDNSLSKKLSKEFSVNQKETELESPGTPDLAILEEDEETTQSLSRRYMRMSDNPERMMAKYKADERKQQPVVPSDFKYHPNWCFIAFLLTMLSIQGVQTGYAQGTYNRIGPILVVQYGWTTQQQQVFEGLISSLLVLGITVGRLFGAKFVNRGRKLCLLTSILISLAAIGVMMVLNIYVFLVARFVYGFGAGMFTAVAPRYVEECSPPQYLSLFFTIYTFGISLNRPFLMMADFILPKNEADYKDTNTWRYFILVPAFFGACTIIGTLLVVRHDTPMYLIS